jgi:hypothetical protein
VQGLWNAADYPAWTELIAAERARMA